MRNRQILTPFLICMLGFMLSISPTLCAARPQADPVGTVIALRGEVRAISAAGESRRLAIKGPIFAEDSLTTGQGRVQLLFTDHTIISLGRNTKMEIAEYRWSASAAKDAAMKTKVEEGAFRVLGGAITKAAPLNFTTETPTATIGIRGSSYAGVATPERLTVVLLGGKGINVFNAAGKVALTTPGYGTHVDANTRPRKPVKFSPEQLKALTATVTNNGGDREGKKQEEKKETDKQVTNGGQEEEPAQEVATVTVEESQVQTEDATTDGSLVDTISVEDAPAESDLPVQFTAPPPVDPILDPVVTSDTTDLLDQTETSVTEPTVVPFTLPANGVQGFYGLVSGTSIDEYGVTDTISDETMLEVNWLTKKFIGISKSTTEDKSEPVFYFGSINSDGTIAAAKVIGESFSWDDGTELYMPAMIIGSGTSGQFVGVDADIYFGFNAVGSEVDLLNQHTKSTWSASLGGSSVGIDPGDETAPTGTVTWNGFVSGLAENIQDPDNQRRLFGNISASDVSLTINRDAGTVSGTISAVDALSSSYLSGIEVGGAYGSAYVLDDALIGLLGCSSGNCVSGSGDLQPNTSFLVTENPDTPISSYAEWGIWEASYVDPYNSAVYHVHMPGSWWVAGEVTPVSVVSTLTGTASYSGPALAAKIGAGSLDYLKGTASLLVDFSPLTAGSVTGSISFPNEPVFNIGGSSATTSGFNASLTGTGVSSGYLNGAFFGPSANAVAGNFNAVLSDADSTNFVGIYAADHQ